MIGVNFHFSEYFTLMTLIMVLIWHLIKTKSKTLSQQTRADGNNHFLRKTCYRTPAHTYINLYWYKGQTRAKATIGSTAERREGGR